MTIRKAAALALLGAALLPGLARAEAPLRKIGELELRVLGVSAACDPAAPVVPRNTPSAVRVLVRAGATGLSAADVRRLFGGDFEVQGELSGPGLAATVSLPHGVDGTAPASSDDPLLLPLPGLSAAGDYLISNLRIVSGGRPVLDVTPASVPLKVIEQVLVTSVKTRPLTLEEIQARGIDLRSADNYLGFAFTLGLKVESKVVSFTLPVVFDRKGVVVPEPVQPPAPPPRIANVPISMPTIVPVLLEAEPEFEGGPAPSLSLPMGSGGEVRIPGVLVIPGDVGYLKQFFSAQLFVSNGAPAGSQLTLHDVTGKIELPPSPGSGEVPPLALPPLVRDGQSVAQAEQLPVRGVGPDGESGTADDTDVFVPGEQGMADFTVRGDAEGFHPIEFDIRAVLDGLPVGPVRLKGRAKGGVLVRNASLSMAFSAPSVVRTGEGFTLYVTVTNVGQGTGNSIAVEIGDAISGLELAAGETGSRTIPTLLPGRSTTLEFRFESLRTGQVVASYLRFDATPGSGTNPTGSLLFHVGVGERGVALSPDTLSLPTSVEDLPPDVVRAAMRVLGQAWSVANAPRGTLPSDVLAISRNEVTKKALALAEAGLRVRLGQSADDAIRDVLYDLWSGEPAPDAGFDQLLRTTEAGRELADAIGAFLGPAAAAAGGALDYERAMARVLASGRDFVSLALVAHAGAVPDVALVDDLGRRSVSTDATASDRFDLPGLAFARVGAPSGASRLGLLTAVDEALYHVEIAAREAGPVDLAVTLPRGDGTVVRGVATGVAMAAGERAWVSLNLARPRSLTLERDTNGDGLPEETVPLALDGSVEMPEGPRLVAARIVGPETIAGASPLGLGLALLFDRVVDPASAADTATYAVPANRVQTARRQLSGRLVFASLDQPEGNEIGTTIDVEPISDLRGHAGTAATGVTLLSLITDPGAVVTGRVLNGDRTPLAPGVHVTYLNTANVDCGSYPSMTPTPVSQMAVAADGSFEFRYVRRDPCGAAFKLVTQDPLSGALREITRHVRAGGERIAIDIALFARGSVTGTVTRFLRPPTPAEPSPPVGPAAGVTVLARSVTDPASGASAITDGDGRYTIDGITVGPVNVSAGGSAGIGSGVGRIDRPGTPAVVDVLLDENAVSVNGRVDTFDPNEPDPSRRRSPAAGLQVLFYSQGVLVAAATTGADGAYSFPAVPAGQYRIDAALNSRDRASATGTANVGLPITVDLLIELPRVETLGTVRGLVLNASGQGEQDVYVTAGDVVALTDGTGHYVLSGVGVSSTVVSARTRDGKRSAIRGFSFPGVPSPEATVDLRLSGIGSARFTVLDPEGRELHGHEVFLQGVCGNPCGCAVARTGANDGQPAVFSGLPYGNVTVRAFRPGAGYTDLATATVSITNESVPAAGVLRFAGTGSVRGVVYQIGGSSGRQPAMGAQVALSSRVFINDGETSCALFPGQSHFALADANGEFAFPNVLVGDFGLTAWNQFLGKEYTVGARGTIARAGDSVGPIELQFEDTMAEELSGTVFLPDGLTPAGAGVEVSIEGALPRITIRTDPNGRFAFAPILAEGTWTLTAEDRATGGTARKQVYLTRRQTSVHDLRLEGRGRVRVHVLDTLEQPVPQASVELRETDWPSSTYQALLNPSNDGVVEFSAVYEGGLSITVSDPLGRGGRASAVLPRAGETIDVTVRVTTTGTVTGHFRMPGSGAPIPLATVTLQSGGRVVGQATTASSGDVGSFSFSYVPAGPIRVDAQDPLTARSGFNVGSIEREGDSVTLDVTAQSLGTVQGLVTLNGQNEPRARVELVSGSFRVSTFADVDGEYHVQGVPAGRVVVTASRSGGGLSGTATGVLAEENETLPLDVALRSTGRIEGVVRAADGAVATTCRVTVTVGGFGGATLHAVTAAADGTFAIEDVPVGTATIDVEAAGSIDRASTTATVVELQTTPVDVRLNGVGSIAGTVVGLPADYEADVILSGTGRFPYQVWATTTRNDDGTRRFRVPELLAGPVTARLRVTGTLPLQGMKDGTVGHGVETPITVEVQPTGSVSGLVLRADDSLAFGAEVTLDTVAGRLRTAVGADGSFGAVGIPTGPVVARVVDPLTGGVGEAGGTVVADAALALPTIRLDAEAIRVLTVDPGDGATGVPLTMPVQLTVSDPVVGGWYGIGVSVLDGTRNVVGRAAASADGLTLTVWPNGAWPDGRELSVTASTALTDVFGRHPAATFTSRFRTVDVSPPAVVDREPADSAIQVGPGAVVRARFDEPISATVDPAALLTLARAGFTPVAGTVMVSGDRVEAVFTPADPLAANEWYRATVTGAEDAAGNRIVAPVSWAFVTTDTVPPILTPREPATWTRSARPQIRFELADPTPGSGIDPAPASASMTLDGTPVAHELAGLTLRFTPPAPLADGAHSVEGAARDRAGNAGMAAFGFGVDTVAPGEAVITGPSPGPVSGDVTITASAADATSGVAWIEAYRSGQLVARLDPPGFTSTWRTSGAVAEGPATLTAQAVDVAGNIGPMGPPVSVLVNNNPALGVSIVSPAAASRYRDQVTVRARTSEPAARVDFSVAAQTAPGTMLAPDTFEATLDLSGAVEGDTTVTASATGLLGETAAATLNVVVDRTPPAAPRPDLITAEESDAGYALVQALPGAVEARAAVEVTNPAGPRRVTVAAAQDGSFAARLEALLDDVLEVVAIDSVGNRSVTTAVTVGRRSNEGGVPLAGLKLWASADDGVAVDASGRVTRWTDRSDAHNDLVPPSTPSAPVLVSDGFNGAPVLRFDGADDTVVFTTRLYTIVRTVFWVVKETGPTGATARSLLADAGYYHFHGGTGVDSPEAPGSLWSSYAAADVRNGQTRLDGQMVDGMATPRPRQMAVISWVTAGSGQTADRFGAGGSTSAWSGDLAELIVYDRALTAGERQAVEDYLVRKWRPYAPTASTPSIAPAGGTFTGSTTIQLSTFTPGAETRYTLDGSEPDASSALYTDALVVDRTTTVKARAFAPGYLDSATATATFVRSEESPVVAAAQVGGMSLWWRADAGIATNAGSWVTRWNDQSGSGNDGWQTSGAATPVLVPNAVNGLPVLRFGGAGDEVRFATRLYLTVRTVFWVVKETGPTGATTRSLLGDEGYYHFHGGTGVDSPEAPGVLWSGYAATDVRNGRTQLNGRPVDGTSTPRPRQMAVVSWVTAGGGLTADRFGAGSSTSPWRGDLAELIVYDRALSADEVRQIEDYLLWKYGIGGQVTAPRIEPSGGVFDTSQEVRLSTQTPGAEIRYTLDGSEPTASSAVYTDPLQVSATTTVKARAFQGGYADSETTTAGFIQRAQATPQGTSALQASLKLWWRADAGVPSGTGAYWEDQSGGGNHGWQTSGAATPVLVPNAVNGLPVLRFDGAGDEVRFATRLYLTVRTVFWVVKETGPTGATTRSLLGDEGYYHFHGGTGVDSPEAPGVLWSGYAAQDVRNGRTQLNGRPVDGTSTPRPRQMAVVSWVTAGSGLTADRFGAGSSTSPWRGDLAELIVYDRALSADEVRQIEDYLLWKYGIGGQVTSPRIEPSGGVFDTSQEVRISTLTPGAEVRYTLDGSEPMASSALYTDALQVTATTTVKAKAFLGGYTDSETTTAGFIQRAQATPLVTPALQANLKLWWRADAGVPSGTGAYWEDQSGGGNHGWQTSGAATPVLVPNAVNGLPVLRFDGAGDEVRFATRLYLTVRTAFWVVKETGPTGATTRSLLGDEGYYHFHGGTGVDSPEAPGPLWSGYAAQDVRNGRTQLNGRPVDGMSTPRPRQMAVVSWVTAGGGLTADRFGAGSSTSPWRGDLAELIVYDRALSTDEVRQIEDYLNARYRLFIR